MNPIIFASIDGNTLGYIAERQARETFAGWAQSRGLSEIAKTYTPTCHTTTLNDLHGTVSGHIGSPIDLIIQSNSHSLKKVLTFLQGLIRDFPEKINKIFFRAVSSCEGKGSEKLVALDKVALAALKYSEPLEILSPADFGRFLNEIKAPQLGITAESSGSNASESLRAYLDKVYFALRTTAKA